MLSFCHKGLKIFCETGSTRGLPSEQVPKIRRILTAIDEANEPEEVGLFPGWRLHLLSRNMQDFWSVTVTGNWRIIFRFEDGNANELDYLDYH
ncbi:MAG: Killer protein [Alphaproteobacteria bacterium]|nr:Killer protein [Alphaproteobacteria bacterium]